MSRPLAIAIILIALFSAWHKWSNRAVTVNTPGMLAGHQSVQPTKMN